VIKIRFLTTIGLISTGLIITSFFSTGCSSSVHSELFFSSTGDKFYDEVTSKEFYKNYVSNKGKPQNYSKERSSSPDVCKKINSLLKPKDMIFLMAYDVLQMFDDNEEDIRSNCANVTLHVDKFNDESFSISQF
jgi:hypothetical protein